MTTPISPDMAERLAVALHEAIAANDLDRLRNDVYTADVTIWHNNDGIDQDVDTNLRVLGWLHKNVTEKSYDDVRRQPTPTGFVEQHVLRGTTRTGVKVDVPACLVATVRGDRICRIEEYVDSAHLAPLMG